MKVQFCGAARKVTGSCYYIETSTKKLLVDCGLHQGKQVCDDCNLEEFPFDPSTVDAVFLTHAHLDHCGRLPRLVQKGFNGKIYGTKPTMELANLILEDSVHILEEEALEKDREPVFTEEDYIATVPLFENLDYHEVLQLDDNITVELFDAGHILGSSMVKITADGESIVFSGDMGNSPTPLLNNIEHIKEASYVVMESTYGGRVHEDKNTRQLLLQSAIYETIIMGGVLMIPAFAMERTQEILYELNELVNNKDIPPVTIFLDSPLAIKATQVFKDNDDYFNLETQEIIDSGDDIFNFPGLRMTLRTNESKQINGYPAPKVIIAGSGMAQGGRITHHIERYIGHYANQYLIVGYQVEGSLGRQILDGKKKILVKGEEYEVNAKVRAIGGYSAHADQPKLTTWITGFDTSKLKGVFITHGEEDQAFALQRHLQQCLPEHVDIQVPEERYIAEL